MSQKITKNAAVNSRSFIKEIGDLSLSSLYTITDKKNPNIRKLNIPGLVEILIKKTLELNGDADKSKNNVSFTKAEEKLINSFVSSFKNTVTLFMDFLDYDHDHQVNLIVLKKDGTIEAGKDITAFETDMKEIGSAFKKSDTNSTNPNIEQQVFATLSKIFVYLTSDRFKETKEDVSNFTDSVKQTFTDLQNMKKVNYKKVFSSKIDDMISFIIMFCVILMPIIDLVNSKLAEINEIANGFTPNEISDDNVVITNSEINKAIKKAYGDNLEYVINMVSQLTTQLTKSFSSGGCFSKCACGSKKN
jgi:hypothetical protein